MMKNLPSGVFVAVVCIAATSLPAHGSVMQRQALFSPLKTCATILFYNYYEPNFNIGGRPKGNYIYKLPIVFPQNIAV